MKHFYRMLQGFDTGALSAAVAMQPQLWDVNQVRTSFKESPHHQVNDILLRFNDIDNPQQHECVHYPAWYKLPEAQQIVFFLMTYVRGTRLGRVMITNLAPGCRIAPHIDAASDIDPSAEIPYGYYTRYHVVLQSNPGCLFRCGDEKVNMQTGEVWYFNRHVEHEVVNNSADDRIHLIVDIRSER